MHCRVVMGAGLLHSAGPASGGTRPFRPHPCMHSRYSSCASGVETVGACPACGTSGCSREPDAVLFLRHFDGTCSSCRLRTDLAANGIDLQDRNASRLTEHVVRATLTFVNCRKCGRSAVRPQLRPAHQRCRGYCRRDNDGEQCT